MSQEADLEQEQMREIVADFLIETDELTEALDRHFVELETRPGDPDLLNEIFRAVHTIKGTSSFLGLDQVTLLSHRIEDVLNKLRRSVLEAKPSTMDVLLEGLDILKTLLDQVRRDAIEELDLSGIIGHLTALAGADVPPDRDRSTAIADPAAPTTSREWPAAKAQEEQTIRVDIDRLDTLMNLVGELVLGRNSLMQTVSDLNSGHDGDQTREALNDAARSIDFVAAELQGAAMKMRMLPVGKVFSRFPRQVRDLSRELGKDIQLIVSGNQIELDKSVIDQIGDPLMHVIRNSCDHGLESLEERIALGKPPQGTIELDAAHEGSNIVITVRDDGRGFDSQAIREKIVASGRVTPEELNEMSESEVLRHVFKPGFSTAAKVTDVSGRGVGMDVVRSNIERLNGTVELDSVTGQGSCLTIKLPLTLAIVQGLLIECYGEILIIPLAFVNETVRMDPEFLSTINGRPVLRLRDEVIALVDANEVLGDRESVVNQAGKAYVVILHMAGRKIGLPIDRFLGQEEVVIKGLGDYLGATRGIAGAAILGDGRVHLIVDVATVFRLFGDKNA